MALNTNKELKLYYGIAEVAEKFGVAESLLRYWEKEFPNIAPKKKGTTRQYTKEDLAEIQVVYNLLKVKGLKISAARKILQKNRKGADDQSVLLSELTKMREELIAIRRELNDLV